MKISELPKEVRELARKYFNDKDNNLSSAFVWEETKEGFKYWEELHEAKPSIKETITEPKHYDNSKGSLYKFCDEHELNAYEFDIIKRVMRCRKKGLFLEDLEKTKFLIDLYIKEEIEKHR